jgi:uncharacterized protein (DUF58 family)
VRWPFKTRPTRQSGVLLTAVILVMLGIGGTQNNLLYIVFAILATCVVLGWLGPAFLSRRVSLKRNIPATAYEGSEVSLEVDVCNRSRVFRTPAFIVEDANRLAGNTSTPALVDSIGPGGAVRFRLPMTLTRRGCWSLGDMHLVTGFPMGVFEREWHLRDEAEILVYPPEIT